jgi:hypothetical protein
LNNCSEWFFNRFYCLEHIEVCEACHYCLCKDCNTLVHCSAFTKNYCRKHDLSAAQSARCGTAEHARTLSSPICEN